MRVSYRKRLTLIAAALLLLALCLAGCVNQASQPETTGGQPAQLTEADLRAQLTDETTREVTLTGDIDLTQPVTVAGQKTLTGEGVIRAAFSDGAYMIQVSTGGELTVGGAVTLDAKGTAGGIQVAQGATCTLEGTVKNASADLANARVEGLFFLDGGTLSDAQGDNLYNTGETMITAGLIQGSGEKFAGVHNEGLVTQNGGEIAQAYLNVLSTENSQFVWNGGVNRDSRRDGLHLAEGAQLTVTSADAQLTGSGARGIFLQGAAVIEGITLDSTKDTGIRVTPTGSLELKNGSILRAGYNGVENAGKMVMSGGQVYASVESGIVNTGSLEITGGDISDNGNKGVLNKLDGTAKIVSADVMFSGNRFAVANEDKAHFELANAKFLLSTSGNVYCYGGYFDIHDVVLSASSSNNFRVGGGQVTMKNVEVNGNSASSTSSMHGILIDGGVITAENVTVRNATGHALRNKGGQFTGTNIKIEDCRTAAISSTVNDWTGLPGTLTINGLVTENPGKNNIISQGDGAVVDITNGDFGATPNNIIRTYEGTSQVKLTNCVIRGHNPGSANNVHGALMDGGVLVLNNVTIWNITGHALRNRGGTIVGNQVTVSNVTGEYVISSTPNTTSGVGGSIRIDGFKTVNIRQKNIYSNGGTVSITNGVLAPANNNSVRMTKGKVILKDTEIQGHQEGSPDNVHGIYQTGGELELENVTIHGSTGSGLRVNGGTATGTGLILTDLARHGIYTTAGSVELTDVKIDKIGAKGVYCDDSAANPGSIVIHGLDVVSVGNGFNSVDLASGTIRIIDGTIGQATTNSVRITGGEMYLENVTVLGCVPTKEQNTHGIFATGGVLTVNNVTVSGTNGAALRVDGGKVTGNTVTAENLGTHGIQISKGSVTLDAMTVKDPGGSGIHMSGSKSGVTLKSFRVENAGEYGINTTGGKITIDTMTATGGVNANINSDGKNAVTVINGGTLDKISGNYNNVRANQGSVTLRGVKILGHTATATNIHGVIAGKGGTAELYDVTITGTGGSGLRVNGGTITGSKVTIDNPGTHGVEISAGSLGTAKAGLTELTVEGPVNGIHMSGGTVYLDKLTVQDARTSGINITDGRIDVGTMTATGGTNVNINSDGENAQTTIHGGTLGKISGNYNNVRANKGVVTLTDVEIQGHPAKGSGIHGVIVGGSGKAVLNNVVIREAGDSALRVNGGEVVANHVEAVDSGTRGVYITSGSLTGTELQITNAGQYGVQMTGGSITLDTFGIDTPAQAGIYMNKGPVTVGDLTIKNAGTYGIHCLGGSVDAGKLTTEGGTNLNIYITEAAGSVKVDGGTIGKVTGSYNNIKVENGSLTLNNVELLGHTNDTATNIHGIYQTGGEVTLANVNIHEVAGAGLRVGGGTMTGTNVQIHDTRGTAVVASGGETTLTGLTTENVNTGSAVYNKVVGGAIAVSKGTVTVTGGTLGHTASHTVLTYSTGKVVLKDSRLLGSDGTGVYVQAGSVELHGTTVTGAAGHGVENAGTVLLDGGYVYGNDAKDHYDVYNTGTLTLNNATIGLDSTGTDKNGRLYTESIVTITGEALGHTSQRPLYVHYPRIGEGDVVIRCDTDPIAAKMAEQIELVETDLSLFADGSNLIAVVPGNTLAARVGTQTFKTWAEALEYAIGQKTATIQFLRNITVPETAMIPADCRITLDSFEETYHLWASSADSPAIRVEAGASLTIHNALVESVALAEGADPITYTGSVYTVDDPLTLQVEGDGTLLGRKLAKVPAEAALGAFQAKTGDGTVFGVERDADGYLTARQKTGIIDQPTLEAALAALEADGKGTYLVIEADIPLTASQTVRANTCPVLIDGGAARSFQRNMDGPLFNVASGGSLTIAGNFTLDGQSRAAAADSPLLRVPAGTTVTLTGVTLLNNKNAGNGSAILVEGGDLTMNQVSITGCDTTTAESGALHLAGGTTVLNQVTIQGNGSKDTGKYGIYADGATLALNGVTIQNVKNTGVRLNATANTVTGTGLTVDTTGGYGVQQTDKTGTLTLDTLTIKNTANYGFYTNGSVNKIGVFHGENAKSYLIRTASTSGVSSASIEIGEMYTTGCYSNIDNESLYYTITVNGGTLGATSDNNAKCGAGKLILKNVTVAGNSAASLHGVFSAGGTTELEDVIITGATSSGVRVSSGTVTATDVTIQESGSNGVGINGGTFEAHGVTIQDTGNYGLYVYEKGTVTGENVTIEKSGKNGVYVIGGSVNVSTLNISGSASENINCNADGKGDPATVTVNGGTFGAITATANNVRANVGTVTLTNVEIQGHTHNTAGAHGAIVGAKGVLTLNNVTMVDAADSGIRVNGGKVTGTGATVISPKSGNGIQQTSGSLELDSFTVRNAKVGVNVTGGTAKLGTVEISECTSYGVSVGAKGTVTINGGYLHGNDTVTHYEISNAGTLTLSGVTVGYDSEGNGGEGVLHTTAAVTVTGALGNTAEKPLTIDWPELTAGTTVVDCGSAALAAETVNVVRLTNTDLTLTVDGQNLTAAAPAAGTGAVTEEQKRTKAPEQAGTEA